MGLFSSLIFLDIDGFKAINDTYGHLVGDQVLSFLGEILQKYLRKDALSFRYGGDEFVVVLPSTNLQEAKKAIERIRQIFSTQNGFPFPISFSYGISEIKDPEEIGKVLSHADQEMYVQKRQENQSVI